MAQAEVARMSAIRKEADEIGKVGGDAGPNIVRCSRYHECGEEGWSTVGFTNCQKCEKLVCLKHRALEAHHCPYTPRKERQTASSAPREPRPKDAGCGAVNCKETVRPPLQDHYTCKQCRVTFCHKHLYQNNHQCKSIPPAPDKNAGKQAVARLRANWKNILGTPVSSKQSTGSAANPIALDGDSGKKRTSLFSKSTAIPGPKPIKAEANEVVIVRQGLKGNDKLPANKRCTIAVQAKVEEVGKEGGSENTSGQDANADAGKEAKKVVKVYRMRAFFNEDWVIGRVMDEALRLLGLENLNASEVPQEQKWGVMIEDGNRGELIDAGKILKQVKSAHPGKTLTIRKGYMLDREQMMAL